MALDNQTDSFTSMEKIECAFDEIIMIFKGHNLAIDVKDLGLFAKYSWYPIKKHKVWYLVRNGESGIEYFHRSIFNQIEDGLEVDHINGNGLDNRKSNLRIVTHQVNQNNQRNRTKKEGQSKYRYVHWCKRDSKWMAMVSNKNLGRYKTQEEAALTANSYITKNKLDKMLVEL